jgi:hypothetical protein
MDVPRDASPGLDRRGVVLEQYVVQPQILPRPVDDGQAVGSCPFAPDFAVRHDGNPVRHERLAFGESADARLEILYRSTEPGVDP